MTRIRQASAGGPREAAEAAAISRLVGADRIAAQVLRYEPNELELAVRSPNRGWLLVTDRWAPGWRATVNGRPTDVGGGNFVFRAVPVDAGPNAVRFSYRPTAWPGARRDELGHAARRARGSRRQAAIRVGCSP